MEFKIFCEEYDFSALCGAMEGEAEADCTLSAEVVFTDKEGIRKLNAQMRSIDKVTDVLSFPTINGVCGKYIKGGDFPYDIDEEGALFIGSVVICTQVAREQAEEYGHSYERELFYLAVHGLCHLLGYDHIEENGRALMRQKEERILDKLGLKRV